MRVQVPLRTVSDLLYNMEELYSGLLTAGLLIEAAAVSEAPSESAAQSERGRRGRMNGELIDLLGAMGDYFDARREESEALDKHRASGEHSWDYWGADYITHVEKAYKRVEEEWAKVFSRV